MDLLSLVYQVDTVGNITGRTETGALAGPAEAYTYDAIDQLTGVTKNLVAAETFTYDATGNRTSDLAGTTYAYDPLMNRLTQMGSATYAYDASGNRTSKSDSGVTASYAWSSGNELTGVTHTPSGDSATYRYDALGRRVQRVHTVAGSGTTTDEFVYDGLDLLAMNRGGAVYQQYVHGPGIDQPLALLDYSGGSLAVYYYHADNLGSIRALTDATQAVVQTYTYTAFGVTTVGSPGGLDQPFRYTAREWDAAAGLYYYRARWYDPDAGRFVSPDPIGFAGGTTNLYGYVGNVPTFSHDPSGLQPPPRTILEVIRRFHYKRLAKFSGPWAVLALTVMFLQSKFFKVVGPVEGDAFVSGPLQRYLDRIDALQLEHAGALTNLDAHLPFAIFGPAVDGIVGTMEDLVNLSLDYIDAVNRRKIAKGECPWGYIPPFL